jgi:hypothetical protein
VVVNDLKAFQSRFSGYLPPEADRCILDFLCSTTASAVVEEVPDGRVAHAAIAALAVLEAEVTFILSGRQEQIRARSERALIHLQRTLAVDSHAQVKWRLALQEGESACERLGAVHLLSHGIFAFKVHAVKGRTDLVYPELPDETQLARAVDGFVLT